MEYLKIVLRSDLCAGNGESVGNAVDTDVCMDGVGLPYIPSRRLKGCLKQSAFDLEDMGYPEAAEKTQRLFGDAYGKEGCLFIQDAVMEEAGGLREFLTKTANDPQKPEAVRRTAHSSNVERMFSMVRGQTKLEEGVKVENTLRFTRVISHYNPFELAQGTEMVFYAPICLETADAGLRKFLEDCCRATRHIGTLRSRGLGNVTISVCHFSSEREKSLKNDQNDAVLNRLQPTERVRISYHVTLDAPVTLPGCNELNTSIPARSVIGCLARSYLQNGNAGDVKFRSLFQNGDVCWSALTPVIHGVISDPVPMTLVKLKNDGGRMVNHLLQKDNRWKSMKPKTMDGAFASICSDKDGDICYIAEPAIHTIYHNAINRTGRNQLSAQDSTRTLYMQDSIDAGSVYGGTVVCTAAMAKDVLKCLTESELRFGRSKSAQYAACSLKGSPVVEEYKDEMFLTEAGEVIYVILKSDLAVMQGGRYVTGVDEVRKVIAQKLQVSAEVPVGQQDYCRYHTVGGYQAAWSLQKPQIPVVRAGSVYCFEAAGEKLPAFFQTGQFIQEGFGVCQVMTKEQMRAITEIKKCSIDPAEPQKNEERIRRIYTKLLVTAGLEAMKRYALDYPAAGKEVPVGRLRLMLSEAKDYQDLIRMIGTIKESDVSTEKEVGRKGISEELVKGIYANERGSISQEKLFGKEKELFEEIKKDPKAQELLLKEWKIPLEIILHKYHYAKER